MMELVKPKKIVFGGGCFWCTEAIFKNLNGVLSVMPGYAGGMKANPTYEEVSTGTTGHAEVTEITYDSGIINLEDLLTVFFATHDPTTLNRQGHDVGTQYRSVIFYTSEEQKTEIDKFVISLQKEIPKEIVTEIQELQQFYPAENYHKDYFTNNKEAPYCQIVIQPKLDKLHKKFRTLLKENNS
jgi:methionine-S-sulfoxide reductase